MIESLDDMILKLDQLNEARSKLNIINQFVL